MRPPPDHVRRLMSAAPARFDSKNFQARILNYFLPADTGTQTGRRSCGQGTQTWDLFGHPPPGSTISRSGCLCAKIFSHRFSQIWQFTLILTRREGWRSCGGTRVPASRHGFRLNSTLAPPNSPALICSGRRESALTFEISGHTFVATAGRESRMLQPEEQVARCR
jgi:hypothetical protein